MLVGFVRLSYTTRLQIISNAALMVLEYCLKIGYITKVKAMLADYNIFLGVSTGTCLAI
jgi:hypothetical protein